MLLMHAAFALIAALAPLPTAPEVAAPPVRGVAVADGPVIPLASVLSVASLDGRMLIHVADGGGFYLTATGSVRFDGARLHLTGTYSRGWTPGAGPAGDDPVTLIAIWKDERGVEHKVVTDCRDILGRWECMRMHMDMIRFYQQVHPPAAPASRPTGRTGHVAAIGLRRRVA